MRGFNDVWRGDADGSRTHTPGSRSIFEVCFPNATKRALVGVFPIVDVAGGHTFFVQQLHAPTAKWPMAVHATCKHPTPSPTPPPTPRHRPRPRHRPSHATAHPTPLHRPLTAQERSSQLHSVHSFAPPASYTLAASSLLARFLTTDQFGDMPDYPFGKRQRFRDWGLWLADDDSELITSNRYLVLDDDLEPAPRAKWEVSRTLTAPHHDTLAHRP
jgi:hypothetical protein